MMGISDSLLEARGLGRDYDRHTAVQDYELTLARGEILGLLGPNGAGKSTTLRMLSGTLAPSRGSININGIDLLERPRLAKRDLGYLPDQPPLYLDLNVEEYLRYCAGLRGMTGKTTAPAIEKVLETCALKDVRRRLIAHLSLGYQQRVGIAQAIIHEPDLVILDEPTTGLDPIQITAIRDLIRSLAETHAVILSTHILSEVEAVCTRVQIINEGSIVHETDMGMGASGRSLYRLQLGNPPETPYIQSIPGVEKVTQQGRGAYQVYLDDTEQGLLGLTRAAVEHGWALHSLCPLQESLEQIFIQKVFGETAS